MVASNQCERAVEKGGWERRRESGTGEGRVGGEKGEREGREKVERAEVGGKGREREEGGR